MPNKKVARLVRGKTDTQSQYQKKNEAQAATKQKSSSNDNQLSLETAIQKWQSLSETKKWLYGCAILMGFGFTGLALAHYLPIFIQQLNFATTSNPSSSVKVSSPQLLKTAPVQTVKGFYPAHSFYAPKSVLQSTAKVPCLYDPAQIMRLTLEEKEAYLDLSSKICIKIRELLPYAINPTALRNILKSPDFSFYIVPKSYMRGATGIARDKDTVLIALDEELLKNEDELLDVLRNEMHHIVNLNTNFKKTKNNEIFLPFINMNGRIDRVLYDKLDKNVDDGIDLCRYYNLIFTATLSPEEESFKNELRVKLINHPTIDPAILQDDNTAKEKIFAAIEQYQPSKNKLSLSHDEFQEKLAENSITKDENNTYILNAFLSSGIKIRVTNVESSATHMHLYTQYGIDDSPPEKVYAFLKDFQKTISLYTTSIYAEKSPEVQLAELCSHIEQLPTNLRSLLFSDWCNYFEDYHEIKDYCLRYEKSMHRP